MYSILVLIFKVESMRTKSLYIIGISKKYSRLAGECVKKWNKIK